MCGGLLPEFHQPSAHGQCVPGGIEGVQALSYIDDFGGMAKDVRNSEAPFHSVVRHP